MKVSIPFLLCALVLLALSAAGVSAAPAPPGLPPLPGLPEVPGAPPTAPKGSTARFKLVVEGRASASRLIGGESNNGVCEATVSNASVSDQANYGRGKGVTMEAIRFGTGKRSGVLITRAGRASDLSFVVRGTVRRGAAGSYDWHPVSSLPCLPAPYHYEFASNPDCGVTQAFDQKMALAYNSSSGEVALKFLGLRAFTAVDDCSREPHGFGALADLTYAWPSPPGPVKGTLPAGKLFSARKPFEVHLRTPNINETTNGPIQGGLFGTVTDRASHEAVLRIIPLGSD